MNTKIKNHTKSMKIYLPNIIILIFTISLNINIAFGQEYNCSSLSEWNAETVYSASGQTVFYNNNVYQNNYWTQNENPESSGEWGAWEYLGTCSSVSSNAQPEVSITSPSGATELSINEEMLIIAEASDSDGTIAGVEFMVNGTSIETITTSPYSISWSSDENGTYLISVIAKDNEGLVSETVSVSITVSDGRSAETSTGRNVIGYITNWDAWKAESAGLPAQGALTHLNIDYSKYTILNYSFFGVANDGSLHSGDLRNKNIYLEDEVQEQADILYTDIYSSWDLHILFGEIDPIQYLSQDNVDRCIAQGFEVELNGTTWSNPVWGLSGSLPVPIHNEDGAPGLFELAHENGVKVMASIGGWSMCKHFPEMAADSTKRARFINDCVTLINMGFDGIDLDWEYPGPFSGMNFTGTEADYANFTTLVSEIREAIGDDKLISAAMSASGDKTEGFEWDKLVNIMDYFNIMTYDFNGGWSDKAGHNSPLYDYEGS